MKVKANLDTDDYLILLLLFVGGVIAIFGIYMIFSEVIQYLSGALSNLNVN